MTAALKDLTQNATHHLVINVILSCRTCKRWESTCVGNRRIRGKQIEVLEMAERESRNWFVFGKIRESKMCVSDCIQKISVPGFLFLLSRDDPVWTNKSTFCLIVLLFQVYFILFWYLPISSRKRGFSFKIENRGKKYFPLEKKSISILFSLELWYLPISSRKRGFSRKWKSKIVEKNIFR